MEIQNLFGDALEEVRRERKKKGVKDEEEVEGGKQEDEGQEEGRKRFFLLLMCADQGETCFVGGFGNHDYDAASYVDVVHEREGRAGGGKEIGGGRKSWKGCSGWGGKSREELRE